MPVPRCYCSIRSSTLLIICQTHFHLLGLGLSLVLTVENLRDSVVPICAKGSKGRCCIHRGLSLILIKLNRLKHFIPHPAHLFIVFCSCVLMCVRVEWSLCWDVVINIGAFLYVVSFQSSHSFWSSTRTKDLHGIGCRYKCAAAVGSQWQRLRAAIIGLINCRTQLSGC